MTEDKKNILWHSNAPWANTGYGNQTRIFGPRLQEKLDYKVVVSAFWGLGGATLKAYGMTVLPGYAESYGNDVLRAHSQFTEADIVITLMDAWVLKPEIMREIPWAAWMPIDHDPIPIPVLEAIKEGNGVPIAMSRFGEQKLLEAGLDALYVPHSPDVEFFGEFDRDKARKLREWDDKFIIGMVAANKGWPCRKAFPEVFEAFKMLLEKRDDVHLHLHTKKDSPWGVDLGAMLKAMNIPDDKVSFVDQYQYVVGMGTSYMVDTYGAMDVLVNPAYGEGFGIPIIEAQATGTPVIVNDFTAMSELVFSGTLVDGEPWYTAQDSWQQKPNIGDIYDAMEFRYKNPIDETEATMLRKTVEAQYHPDVVTEIYWKPVLEECLVRLADRKVVPQTDVELEENDS